MAMVHFSKCAVITAMSITIKMRKLMLLSLSNNNNIMTEIKLHTILFYVFYRQCFYDYHIAELAATKVAIALISVSLVIAA